MITDPYSVLGIGKGASKEEIKRAYRQKAKEYHPDLHPNDPHAAEKMNEINEAYDMLSNPEKYQQRTAQAGYGNASQNSYGQANGSGQTYGGTQWNGSGQGYGGWSSHSSQGYEDFDPFGFGDWFGFGQRSGNVDRPTAEPGDSNEIRQVIDFIYMGNYRYARQLLNTMVSAQRNGRWYYLSAITNYGLGNTIEALEHIRKAILLEPENAVYQKARQDMQQTGTQYNTAGEAYDRYADGMGKMCRNLCLLQCMCMWCC